MSFIAIPYQPVRGTPEADALRNGRIFDHMVSRPDWFNAPMSEDEIRVATAWMLTDPSHFKYEVWRGGELCGMLLVSRVNPKVDCLFHFTFFKGVPIFGLRRVLWSFLGTIFRDFDVQRVSMEVPEHHSKLVEFVRKRLSFRYEGENDLQRLQRNKGIVRFDVPGAPTWVAGQGSRREAAHWNGTGWSDLTLLRLLRSEYTTLASSGEQPKATSENSTPELSHVAGLETTGATVRPGGPAGVPGPADWTPSGALRAS